MNGWLIYFMYIYYRKWGVISSPWWIIICISSTSPPILLFLSSSSSNGYHVHGIQSAIERAVLSEKKGKGKEKWTASMLVLTSNEVLCIVFSLFFVFQKRSRRPTHTLAWRPVHLCQKKTVEMRVLIDLNRCVLNSLWKPMPGCHTGAVEEFTTLPLRRAFTRWDGYFFYWHYLSPWFLWSLGENNSHVSGGCVDSSSERFR